MGTQRFFCPDLQPAQIELDEQQTRHAARVLRLSAGQTLQLFDGAGGLATARVLADDRNAGRRPGRGCMRVQIEQREQVPSEPRRVRLIVSACKGARLDLLVEKCTELGVHQLCLAQFERSVVLPGATHVEKLRRVAIEACKQCRRAWLPQISQAQPLAQHIAASPPRGALALADLGADSLQIGDWLAQLPADCDAATVIIGPEGGVTPHETVSLRSRGAQSVRLAAHVLRVETAALAAAAFCGAWATGLCGDRAPRA